MSLLRSHHIYDGIELPRRGGLPSALVPEIFVYYSTTAGAAALVLQYPFSLRAAWSIRRLPPDGWWVVIEQGDLDGGSELREYFISSIPK